MSKGDKITVIYAVGAGAANQEINATKNGEKLEVVEPRANDPYLGVQVLNKNDGVNRSYRFAKGAVIAVIEDVK